MKKSKYSLFVECTDRAPKVSALRAMKKIKDIATANPWEYFTTLTWEPEISRDYYSVQKRSLEWKKDIEKGGGKVLLVIGTGDLGGLYHAHALVHDMPDDMITWGNPNKDLIEVKTDGDLYSLTHPEDYDIGLHVLQKIDNPDDYNRIGDYMSDHVPALRLQFHDGIFAGVIDKTARMYYASRGLVKSKREWLKLPETYDRDTINTVKSEEMSGTEYGTPEYYSGEARAVKRICYKIQIFDNGKQGAAVVLPAEHAHIITDFIVPRLIETYRRGEMLMCRIVGDSLKELTNVISLSCFLGSECRPDMVFPVQRICSGGLIKHFYKTYWYPTRDGMKMDILDLA